MSKFALIKSEDFHGVQCDFWKNEDTETFCMTSEQLGAALGYAIPRESINKLVSRHEYLRNTEFSGEVKMTSASGTQETRVFTEDGIYEVTMLAKTDRAREFRAKVREILKALRAGRIKAFKEIDPRIIDARNKNAEARLMNARRKDAEFFGFDALSICNASDHRRRHSGFFTDFPGSIVLFGFWPWQNVFADDHFQCVDLKQFRRCR